MATQRIRSGIYARQTPAKRSTAIPLKGISRQNLALPIIPALFKAGLIIPFAGSVIPSRWLACDGSAISRAAYSELFAVLGTAFGAGDGSTTFNLPDLRGRAPIGAGQGASLTNRVLGAMPGSETHALAIGEFPSHDHGASTGNDSPDHDHNYNTCHWASGWAMVMWINYNDSAARTLTTYGANSRHTHSIPSDGSGSAHNNYQPSLGLNFIIRY